MKRRLIIGGVILVAIFAVLFYGVYTSLGQGAIRGLSVGNPEGFTTGHSFQLGEIQLALDVGTITGDPVVVKEILINKPAVTYELGSDGSNIAAIQRNVQAYMGPGDSSKGDTSEGPKLVIENLYIKGGEVNVKTTGLTEQELSTQLPDIHVKDIGKEKGGTSPGEVAKQIMAHLTKGVGSAVATLNLDKLGDAVEEAAKGAKEMLEKDVVEGASGAVKETSEKLKKLLN